MKKLIAFPLFLCLTFNLFSQKVVVEKYLVSGRVKFNYQVDPKTGVKNGYYKSYNTDGVIYEDGFYKMGRKNGTWKTYDALGRVYAVQNYKDDVMDGVYKQWCGEDKIYLCADHFYKNGVEIKKKTYYDNGKIEWDIDDEPASYKHIHYTRTGEPSVKTVDGKIYQYGIDEDGNLSGVDRVDYDTIGMHIEYFYSGHITDIHIYKKDSLVEGWGYNEIYLSYLNKNNPEKKPVDSTSFANGYIYYMSAPDPNKKNEKRVYDVKTGILSVYDGRWYYYQFISDGKVIKVSGNHRNTIKNNTFDEDTVFNFNEVKYGSQVSHGFHFTNNSIAPLKIKEVKPSCSCLRTDYPEYLIMPGNHAAIWIYYDSTIVGYFNKTVSVKINDETFILTVMGTVKP